MPSDRGEDPPARIGPNAVLQLRTTVCDRLSEQAWLTLLLDSGNLDWRMSPPEDMVEERSVTRLFLTVFQIFDGALARELTKKAGHAVGDYILAHRIPRAFQRFLRLLPPLLRARLLLAAIEKHAWTFAGSGRVTTGVAWRSRRAWIEIENNPLRLPDCPWHVGVFETLFGRLVDGTVRVNHCHPTGDAGETVCRFNLTLAPAHADKNPNG